MSDAMDWTPGECCRQTAVQCDERDVSGCVVIMLDKGSNGDGYMTAMRVSGLRYSEIIALLEVVKFDLLKTLSGNDS